MFETEADRQELLEEFGADIALPSDASIKGIVDRKFAEAMFQDIIIDSFDPVAIVSTDAASALKENDEITVSNSGIKGIDGTYIMRYAEPDGTGMTILKLKVI